MIGNGSDAARILAFLEEEAKHFSNIFPDGSKEIVTFTAGAPADDFSAWVEIANNLAVTFSSKVAEKCGHISAVMAESASATDKVYIYEIAYGDDKIIVVTGRIMSGSVRISTTQQARLRGLGIPAGETVYYRMKCETAGADITISMRYHTHD